MAELTVALEIQGMTCKGCAQSIEESLRQHAGVTDVQVDWCCGVGIVAFDGGETDQERIVASPVFQGQYRAKIMGGGCC